MEQGRLVALAPVHVLDGERPVRDEMRDLVLRDLERVDGPGMGVRRPDGGQMALAAAARAD